MNLHTDPQLKPTNWKLVWWLLQRPTAWVFSKFLRIVPLLLLGSSAILNGSFTEPYFENKHSQLSHVMDSMFEAVHDVKSAYFTVSNTERVNGKLLSGKQQIYMERNPFKCYVKLIEPVKGGEVLYVAGKNSGKALYRSGGILRLALFLDPMGSLMRKNNHHTVFEAGFDYSASLIKELYKSTPDSFLLKGEFVWQGQHIYMIEVKMGRNNPVEYAVSEGETLRSLSRKFNISEYKILELNKGIGGFNSKLEGKKIRLPSAYAESMTLYIDKTSALPVFIRLDDENGLYEQYSYSNVVINGEPIKELNN